MDGDMLSPQTKENDSPVHYPELPSPPPHPHTSSPTWHTPSNVSRKRTPRLAGLADTPARSSYAQQMLKHWSTSTPKFPQEHVVTVQGDCSSPKDSFISPTDSDEDPLNDLERAVAIEIPDSPKSKQRRKTLFIPGPHCRQYDSDDTSEAWTGDDVFLGKREGPRVSKVAVSPPNCKRKGVGSPLKNCVANVAQEEVRQHGELLQKGSDNSTCVKVKAEPDEMNEEAFVTARQDVSGETNQREDSGKCLSVQSTSSAESPPEKSKAHRFLDLRHGPLYPKLPESTNSTDLDLLPAPAGTSTNMRLSQENLQKWNKAQLAKPRMSRFYHPAAVTRGTCHPRSDAGQQSKVVVKSSETLSRLSGSKFQSPVLYSTCHLKSTREAEPVVEPEHTSSDADDEDESQNDDVVESPME